MVDFFKTKSYNRSAISDYKWYGWMW